MTNLRQLPNNGFAPSNQSIAAHLRQQADWLEEEDAPRVRNVFMVFEREDGTIHRQTAGLPCDLARAIGVLQIACVRAALGEE